MYEIMLQSEQEYVDEYGSKVKSGEVDVNEVSDPSDKPKRSRDDAE